MSEPAQQAIRSALITEHRQGVAPVQRVDALAAEEPLEIRIQGRGIAITMRTPGHDPELAAGFLVSEGIIHSRADVLEVAPCRGAENVLNIFMSSDVSLDFERLSRHVFASSSCGLCGKATIDQLQQQFPPIRFEGSIEAAALLSCAEQLRASQPVFDRTGSLHAAALFDLSGHMLWAREDVGRHNAVDKAIGRAWLDGIFPLKEHLLFVSGRTSFEIVQKALAAGIPLIAGISGPSSLAVEFAEQSGQTLLGFVRGQSFNLYTHPERVKRG